jgi:hypothetical protein
MIALTPSAELARWRWFFLVSAVYDMALGIAFFFLYRPIFEAIGMPAPSHESYVHLSAVFVLVQGLGYLFLYADPLGNLGLAKVGAIYKASYTLLAVYYLVRGDIPSMFFAWFGLFDFLFFIGFMWFLRRAAQGAIRS